MANPHLHKIQKYKRSKLRAPKPNQLKKLKDSSMSLPLGGTPIAEIALKHVEIWTDGSCQPNPGGSGGWGAIMKFGEHVRELSGAVEAPTTNNQCELLAVINALKEIKHAVRITLRTDSKYVIQVIGGCKIKANADLAREIRELARQHSITCEWVKGHNGDPNNERCDKLADEQRKTLGQICRAPIPIDPPKSVREWQSSHTLTNEDARRERQRLQLEIDRAIGF